ncbi:aldo/keto reductase [Corynebacterium incognita]|uniref:Aldo/keto reductase n=2 Tax=Corynebacterium incognita TaxID=2754725 RepID=A0A7G7CNJ2_9CORY|nr:aldo/keto reductase [Corynebacterium incognita]
MEGMNKHFLPSLTLNDGRELTPLGLGTYKLLGEDCERVVREAIEIGYRHFDTASVYDNEEAVGKAIADAVAAGDVERDDLFITTKLWNDQQGADNVGPALHESLRKLGLDYVDMYLVHWPWPQKGLFAETFEEIARLQGMGQIGAIGVANFYEETLRELVAKVGIAPALNQVELHPGFTQPELREVHKELDIVTEAWAPLSRGIVLQNPVMEGIAAEVGKTPAQVALRFLLQLGCSIVPKSARTERLRENFELFDFSLSEEQMDAIAALDGQPGFGRIFKDPREFPGDVD